MFVWLIFVRIFAVGNDAWSNGKLPVKKSKKQ